MTDRIRQNIRHRIMDWLAAGGQIPHHEKGRSQLSHYDRPVKHIPPTTKGLHAAYRHCRRLVKRP